MKLKNYLNWLQLNRITIFVLVLLFTITLYSFVKSAYYYQFDGDEYYHSQVVYLIDKGYEIYRSFYASYTPIFYWSLQPIYHLISYDDVSVLYSGRIFIILLFLLRLLLLFGSIRIITNNKAALIGIFFIILDPFAAMTAGTIRPDALMLLFYSLGLFVYIYGRKQKSNIFFIFSGVFMSLSLLTLMKIIPSIVAFLIIITMSAIKRKALQKEGLVIFGFIFGMALTSFYFITKNLMYGVWLETVLDPFLVFNGFVYPVYFGFYLKEGNMWIFGPINRSISWIYAQLMSVMGGFGLFFTYFSYMNKRTTSLTKDIFAVLSCALILQWIWLITVPSVFIQYYLTINWIIALLAGCGLAYLWDETKNQNWISKVTISSAIIFLFAFFTYGSYKVNIFRSGITSKNDFENIKVVWQEIPKDKIVFPNFLFRPIAHPIPSRAPFHEIPPAILNRMPGVVSQLVKLNVEYVYNDDWFISHLPEDAKEFINKNYKATGTNKNILYKID